MDEEQSDIRQRLAEAEATIDALRRQEVDAIVGVEQIMLLRLREVEQKLRESEQRFRVLVEATSQAVWETDPDGMVVEESPTWLEYTGQPTGQALGKGWLQAIHPDDRRKVELAWNDAISSLRDFDAEFRLRGPTGSWRWTHVHGAPIRKTPGRAVSKWVCMNVDITRRKESELSLQQARENAEAANRSRGEFMANVSHEIRTPMTAILGYADILHDELSDPDNLQCVETIRRNGKFLLDIINDILDLSKIDAGKLRIERSSVRLDTLLSEVYMLMQVRAEEKKLPVNVDFKSPIPRSIETDAVRLRQILLNLLGNAIKFTEQGSIDIAVWYQPDHNRMHFEVSDTGIGIQREEIDRLFLPFTQADASSTSTRDSRGTGLGLAISRRLAQALGGDISVRSQLHEGSTFTLWIDGGTSVSEERIRPEIKRVARVESTATEDALDGCILVVDDRRDILFFTEQVISDAGGCVLTAQQGDEAIDIVANRDKSHRAIDLILMDMQMPVIDGFETTRHLRQIGFERPIIALTANVMKGDRERCLQAGCNDFLGKPIDRNKLIEILQKWLKDAPDQISTEHSGEQFGEQPDERSSQPSGQLAILCVDDNQAFVSLQKRLLEQLGHRVSTATSGRKALQVIETFTPDAVILDLSLNDTSGATVLKEFHKRPEFNDCLFICISGHCEEDVRWKELGFDYFLQKPADVDSIQNLLIQGKPR